MDALVAIAGALSDKSRVRALLALRGGELCVCQIIELLALAPSTVSKHMAILKSAGLVENRKQERWVYYRLPAPESGSGAVREAIDWVTRSSENDPTAIADSEALSKDRGKDTHCT
jgi:ArsR family transcriptional regulator